MKAANRSNGNIRTECPDGLLHVIWGGKAHVIWGGKNPHVTWGGRKHVTWGK
jgi:hypothetical protein